MIIVITRHQAFVEFLLDEGIIKKGNYVVIPHASPDTLRGQSVIASGLPLHLAALCQSVTTVPLNLPSELRGKELTLPEVREHAGELSTFKVEVKVEEEEDEDEYTQAVAWATDSDWYIRNPNLRGAAECLLCDAEDGDGNGLPLEKALVYAQAILDREPKPEPKPKPKAKKREDMRPHYPDFKAWAKAQGGRGGLIERPETGEFAGKLIGWYESKMYGGRGDSLAVFEGGDWVHKRHPTNPRVSSKYEAWGV